VITGRVTAGCLISNESTKRKVEKERKKEKGSEGRESKQKKGSKKEINKE
jgi:hypothetical protein